VPEILRAIDYTMTYGKHKGLTLFQIACDDPTYLDWLLDNSPQHIAETVCEALSHPDVAKRVNRALED